VSNEVPSPFKTQINSEEQASFGVDSLDIEQVIFRKCLDRVNARTGTSVRIGTLTGRNQEVTPIKATLFIRDMKIQ
jgi:hypothetical protein